MSQQTLSAAEYRALHGIHKTSNVSTSASRAKARMPNFGRSYATEGMNNTETRYASHLDDLLHRGRILGWKYEGVKLRLANKTFYTPDFLIVSGDGTIELHEIKGHWEDDARVKIKAAAYLHPWFRFIAVKTASSGKWIYEKFSHEDSTT